METVKGINFWVWQFTIHVKDTPAQINVLKGMFADIQNDLGWSKTETHKQIYLKGMSALLDDMKDENKNPFMVATLEELIKHQRRLAELSQLEDLRRLMGVEKFEEFCQEHGEDAEDLVAQFALLNHNVKWADRAWFWLCEFLETGEPVATNVIREAALAAEFIDGTSQSWSRLRSLASRKNLTNCAEHGYWQLPVEHRPVVYR